MRRATRTILVCAATFATSVVHAQPLPPDRPADRPAAPDAPIADRPPRMARDHDGHDRQRAAMLDALQHTHLTLDIDGLSARAAIDAVRARLDVPVRARYLDDAVGYGIDPLRRIDLHVRDMSALGVIQELMTQCSTRDEPCTWQLRRGYVELGTKARLSVPAARETRTYYVADLIIDVPDTAGHQRPREYVALELVEKVVENVEPGAWDYGQIDYGDEEADEAPPAGVPHARPAPRRSTGGPTGAPMPPPTTRSRYVPPRATAIIRYWRDVLVVDAPDYIHRQINGYLPPRSASP